MDWKLPPKPIVQQSAALSVLGWVNCHCLFNGVTGLNNIRIVCIGAPLLQEWRRPETAALCDGISCPIRIGRAHEIRADTAFAANNQPLWKIAVDVEPS